MLPYIKKGTKILLKDECDNTVSTIRNEIEVIKFLILKNSKDKKLEEWDKSPLSYLCHMLNYLSEAHVFINGLIHRYKNYKEIRLLENDMKFYDYYYNQLKYYNNKLKYFNLNFHDERKMN